MIYLDYNATTPVDSEVLEAMLPFLRESFGNPSSSHGAGRRTHDAIEAARAHVAKLSGASVEEIIFTSGGTEATNIALRGVVQAEPRRRHIVTSTFEHPATAQTCDLLERQGLRVTRVAVESDGRIQPGKIASALDYDGALVTVMHANNEIGTIQPIGEISRLAKAKGALVHTDAAQTLGKIPVDVDTLGVDLLTIVGHKMYAPQGVGALYVRKGTAIAPVLVGAGHEGGLRPGTENVAGIVGLGKACEVAERRMAAEAMRQRALRDQLLENLKTRMPGIVLHGHPTDRLPNTLFVSLPGVHGGDLLRNVPDVAASTGSACHSGSGVACASLLAIGVRAEQAVGPVRFSLGRATTVEEVEQAAEMIVAAWRRMSTAQASRPTAQA